MAYVRKLQREDPGLIAFVTCLVFMAVGCQADGLSSAIDASAYPDQSLVFFDEDMATASPDLVLPDDAALPPDLRCTRQLTRSTDYQFVGQAVVSVADVDGDGLPELLLANYSSGKLSIFKNTGAGAFADPQILSVGPYPSNVVAGDLTGDGRPELAVANHDDKVITTFQNLGKLQFQQSTVLALTGNPYNLAMVDMDGDGDLDFVAGLGVPTNGVDVVINSGRGVFAPAAHHGSGTAVYTRVADLTGDNRPDVVTVSSRKGEPVWFFRNLGRGDLAEPLPLPASNTYAGSPISIALADMDPDGLPDIVVTLNGAPPQDVSVLRNQGLGRFAAPTDHAVGLMAQTAYGAAAGDIDGDGKTDVVVSDHDGGVLYVLTNAGGGKLNATQQLPMSFPSFVTLADVDADGGLDAIVTRSGSGLITVVFSGCR